MNEVDFEKEVKKIYPDAADHYNDLLRCWFVKNKMVSWEYYGQSTEGRNAAWKYAYETINHPLTKHK